MPFPHDADLDVTVRVYLGANPNDPPGSWPAPVEFTTADRVLRRPIQIRRGRGRNQKTAQAGSCTFWLDNTDGALTPLLPTSTYYPDWDLGVPCDLSVSGVGNAPPYTRHAGNVADVQAVMVPGTGGLNISAVQVTSAGVLRRLSQGSVVKAPMRRAIEASPPDYYWPMEDAQGSTQIASGLPGGSPILPYGSTVTFEFLTGSGGSAGWLNLIADVANFLFSTTVSITPADGFQVEFAGISDQVTGLVAIYASADGDSFVVGAGTNDGEPHYRTVSIAQVGADVVATFYTDGVFSSTQSKLSTTLLSNPRVEAATVVFADGVVQISQLSVRRGVSSSAARASANGFAGEQAHVRIARLCAEEGIPYSGNATASVECGPQQVADVVTALQDAEEVDHGILVEDFAFGLNYLASSQRENLDPIITIDLATYRTTSGTQGDVLTPVRNDARIRNEWTISRPGGSEATVSDPVHIAKRRRYNDSATVGVTDDTRLPDEAGWRVHEGTFDGLRYETVPLDLAANL